MRFLLNSYKILTYAATVYFTRISYGNCGKMHDEHSSCEC